MSFALATPSANMRIASLPKTTPRRLVANPGTSLTRMAVLPMAAPASKASATVDALVPSCFTTSSSDMMGTGLKKCIPMSRSGCFSTEAMVPMERLEVLVPNTASGRAKASTCWKMDCFRSMISGTASTTRSAVATASPRSLTACRWADHAVFCSSVVLPRAMPLSQNALMRSMPAARPSGWASCRWVRHPAWAHTCAMPAPMVPAPMTATVEISMPLRVMRRPIRPSLPAVRG